MIKVLQFGEGNFLRTFADLYFDTLNKEGFGPYGVDIVKPIPYGSLDHFEKQKNHYHICLRGMSNGKAVEDIYSVDALQSVLSPFEHHEGYLKLAQNPDLTLIVSNTTEAGICFCPDDRFDDFEGITYPAKLTQFLFERFQAGLPGVYLLPVELIDNNADELYSCVDRYISLWQLPAAFRQWNDNENHYCNTLVDRIVSGFPADEATRSKLYNRIGEADALISIGEPFGLWAIEKKGDIEQYIKDGRHNIDVVLTNDIGYYKKRKVRVLNGSHTNLVAAGLWHGKSTVYDCMTDDTLSRFVDETLQQEIIPFVSDDIAATASFAESVKERFLNPYLNHQLSSIALNSISKWRARNLPSFRDYYNKHRQLPAYLVKGFAYLMAMYQSIQKDADGKYVASLPLQQVEIHDDAKNLDHFANHGSITSFMADSDVWGEDLTAYTGFAEAVEAYCNQLKGGASSIL